MKLSGSVIASASFLSSLFFHWVVREPSQVTLGSDFSFGLRKRHWEEITNKSSSSILRTKSKTQKFHSYAYSTKPKKIKTMRLSNPNQTAPDTIQAKPTTSMNPTIESNSSEILTPDDRCIVRFVRNNSSRGSVSGVNGFSWCLVARVVPHHGLGVEVKAAGGDRRRAQRPPFFLGHIAEDALTRGDKVRADGSFTLAQFLRAVALVVANDQVAGSELSATSFGQTRRLDRPPPLGFVDHETKISIRAIDVVFQGWGEERYDGVGKDIGPESHSRVALAKGIDVAVVFVLLTGL